MMSWTPVDDFRYAQGWLGAGGADARARECCAALEEGQILFFARPPFDLPEADRQFLLSQRQSDFKAHKNISYRPKADVLRGAVSQRPEDGRRLHEVMRNFSKQVTQFLERFLTPYAGRWTIDYASFRPLEERGRDLSLHKRNDLAHVDAFPTRPTNGGRILRIFTNINPQQDRVWEVTEPFEPLAKKLAQDAGLEKFARGAASKQRAILRGLAPVLRVVGLRGVDRSPYDRFMLRFHDYLKENADFQSRPKMRLEFPPGSTWLVYTDTVPHAVLSGQFALEQTYIVPVEAMVKPASAPIRVLEALCGTGLAN
jgi:hypothetical protein